MGLVHFLQRQFRYHLRQYIFEQMRQLEAQPDVLQLEHRSHSGDDDEGFYSSFLGNAALPHAQGSLSAKGFRWAADRALEKQSFDLPTMDLEWVRHTDDKLFRNMSRFQRHLLYLVYVRDLNWKEISETLDTSVSVLNPILASGAGRLAPEKPPPIPLTPSSFPNRQGSFLILLFSLLSLHPERVRVGRRGWQVWVAVCFSLGAARPSRQELTLNFQKFYLSAANQVINTLLVSAARSRTAV